MWYHPCLFSLSRCGSVLGCPGVWQTNYISGIVYKAWLFVMRVLMPLLRSLTWMRIYRRKALLAQRPIIMIVSGYTLSIKISMANPDRMEWVPISLCENPSLSSPKESVPVLSEFVVICEVIVVF